MKLRHVASTEAFGFQQGLDMAQRETEEAGEIVMSIEHSVAQTTVKEEYGDMTEITYSAILCCMDFSAGMIPHQRDRHGTEFDEEK